MNPRSLGIVTVLLSGLLLVLVALPGRTHYTAASHTPLSSLTQSAPQKLSFNEETPVAFPSKNTGELTSPLPDGTPLELSTREHISKSNTLVATPSEPVIRETEARTPSPRLAVPFYSQLTDITAPEWKRIGCGIASLAMLIEYHKPGSLTSVDTLLREGIQKDAYITNVGWSYAGLIDVSEKYGLSGTAHDLGGQSVDTAFDAFLHALKRGPVMASVHYTFVPTNPIPHLVIMTGIEGDSLFYNDPAEAHGGGTVSVTQFKSSWKKRYIEFFPT